MKLELFCICSLNDFQLLMGLYRGHPLFFLECIYLSLLYSSLTFNVFFIVCVCVCVCVGVVWDFTNSYFYSVFMSVCLGDFFLGVCMCICGLKFTGNYFLLINFVYPYTYMVYSISFQTFLYRHLKSS